MNPACDAAKGIPPTFMPNAPTIRVGGISMVDMIVSVRMLRFVAEPYAVREALSAAGEPDPDGWVRTRLPVESVDVAYSYVMRLGPEAEVLEPPDLRERLADAARRLGELYR